MKVDNWGIAANTYGRMLKVLNELWYRRELVWILSTRNLKIRYKHSVLGFFWSLLTPALFIVIYAVFARILRFSETRPDYLPFLVTGIVAWQFTASCLNDGLNAVTGNANLVKKTRFPRLALPLSLTLANAINFLLTFAVLFLYLVVTRSISFHPLWLLPALLGQSLLCLGVVMIVAAGNVFFRDMQHIVGIGSLAWFFMSPVFYPPQQQFDLLPEGLRLACFVNPMTGLLGAYRTALLGDVPPEMAGLALSLLVSLCIIGVGYAVFMRTERYFGEVL